MNIQTIGAFMLIMGLMCFMLLAFLGVFIMDNWPDERKKKAEKSVALFGKIYVSVAILFIAVPFLFRKYGGAEILLAIPLYFLLRWIWKLE